MQISRGLLLACGVAISTACVLLTVPWHSHDAAVTASAERSSEPEKSDVPSNSLRTPTKTYGSGEKDLRTVTYRLSREGKPRTCDIFDSNGTRLLKCRFGYEVRRGPTQGRLAEVWIFDGREMSPASKMKETPLRRLVQRYESDGKSAEPLVADLVPSGIINAILGSSLLGFDPVSELKGLHSPEESRSGPRGAR